MDVKAIQVGGRESVVSVVIIQSPLLGPQMCYALKLMHSKERVAQWALAVAAEVYTHYRQSFGCYTILSLEEAYHAFVCGTVRS